MLKSIIPCGFEIWVYLKVLGFDPVNVPPLRIMKVACRVQQKNIMAEHKIRQFKMSASLEFTNMPERLRFGMPQQSETNKYFRQFS